MKNFVEHPRMEHFPAGSSEYIDHPSQAKPGIHVYPDRLYVLTMLENPLRWRSRYQNYVNFERMCDEAGAILYTAEVAFENRAFEVTQVGNPRHLQLRAKSESWRKEGVLDLLAQRLPPEAQKWAVLDADIEFGRRDWAQEILHQLAHYDVIQPFSHAINLDGNATPPDATPPTSFLFKWCETGVAPHSPDFMEERPVCWTRQGVKRTKGKVVTGIPTQGRKSEYAALEGAEVWHPGLAWAFRRSAWDKIGGLPEFLITGSGDWFLANALIGQLMFAVDPRHTDGFKRHCQILQDRCAKVRDNPQGGLGYMPGLILHRFHGTHKNRMYEFRHEFVINCGYDPDLDLVRDSQGLFELSERNTKLRDGLRSYARMRDEDGG